MKIRYFPDTDTLHVELRDVEVSETRDLDDDIVIDLDERGLVCAMTIEHASVRGQAPGFSYELIDAAAGAKVRASG